MERKFEAVVMGASAGGLEALSTVLPLLHSDFSLPVMIVMHLPPDKNSILAELLDAKCPLTVSEANDKEPLEAGHVYIAPPDYHLLTEKDRSLSLSSEEEIMYSRPSIDVLFETAADAYGPALIGVVFSGANEDGAKGAKAITKAGGMVLVQDPDSAGSSIMPQSALKICAEARKLSLEDIAIALNNAQTIGRYDTI